MLQLYAHAEMQRVRVNNKIKISKKITAQLKFKPSQSFVRIFAQFRKFLATYFCFKSTLITFFPLHSTWRAKFLRFSWLISYNYYACQGNIAP